MENILLILLIILILVQFIQSNCNNSKLDNYNLIDNYSNKNIDIIDKENFEINNNEKILTSNFLNNNYTLEDNNQFIKFKIYGLNEKYAKIIELEDSNGIKYYHIYINDMILAYLKNIDTEYKLKLYIPEQEIINALFDKYRLYKTVNNKLYFIIDNTIQYLTIDTENNTNNLITTNDESKALVFNF
jgi:hypothetical protein